VAKFVDTLPSKLTATEYSKQLIKASSSIGANVEEADGTLSKKDFINKIAISRREARESGYWLRLIDKADLVHGAAMRAECDWLINEARGLMLILSSIINNTRKKAT
jgi:four helix bundle protein